MLLRPMWGRSKHKWEFQISIIITSHVTVNICHTSDVQRSPANINLFSFFGGLLGQLRARSNTPGNEESESERIIEVCHLVPFLFHQH
jgi:hypothetical protein